MSEDMAARVGAILDDMAREANDFGGHIVGAVLRDYVARLTAAVSDPCVPFSRLNQPDMDTLRRFRDGEWNTDSRGHR